MHELVAVGPRDVSLSLVCPVRGERAAGDEEHEDHQKLHFYHFFDRLLRRMTNYQASPWHFGILKVGTTTAHHIEGVTLPHEAPIR